MEKTTKTCKTCCSEIPNKATKCINCDSHQDWRRVFIFSQFCFWGPCAHAHDFWQLTSLSVFFAHSRGCLRHQSEYAIYIIQLTILRKFHGKVVRMCAILDVSKLRVVRISRAQGFGTNLVSFCGYIAPSCGSRLVWICLPARTQDL